MTLFKRFLLGTSLLQHNLKVMMLTSIYVACKVEENYVSAEEFGKGMHEDASRVLNAELTLLAGLQFQLVTYSPYRAVNGFRCDLEEKTERGDLEGPVTPREKLDECVGLARRTVDKLMLVRVFPPRRPAGASLTAARSANCLVSAKRVKPQHFTTWRLSSSSRIEVEGLQSPRRATRSPSCV